MDFKYIKPIRIIALIFGTLFVIGSIWFGLSYKNNQINHLQQEVNILYNYKLNEPALKERITALENDNTKLKQDLAYYKNQYAADELYINKLEDDYLRCEIYANTAELILKNNGIEFIRVDDD